MSPENQNPTGGHPGDISEDELRRILGDDYDSVVGGSGGSEAGGTAAGPGSELSETAGGTSGPGPSSGPAEEPVVPNMTEEEAEAWAAQMAAQMQETAVGAGVSAAGASAPAGHLSPTSPSPAPARSFSAPPSVQPLQFGQLEQGGARAGAGMDVLMDVKLPISVELGRTDMLVKEILECGPGTVIELNKLAGEPVDVFINGRMVAQGEVVVVDEHFGVRVTNLLSPTERVRSLA